MNSEHGDRLVAVFREVCEPDPLLEETLRLAGQHLDRATVCDAVVDEHGPLIEGTRGTLVANPAMAEARHARVAAFTIIRDVMPDDVDSDDVLAAASTNQKDPAKQRAALARWDRARARSGAA